MIKLLYQRYPTCGRCTPRGTAGVGNLWPAWTSDMVRIRISFTQFRVQNRVETKLHDKQILR